MRRSLLSWRSGVSPRPSFTGEASEYDVTVTKSQLNVDIQKHFVLPTAQLNIALNDILAVGIDPADRSSLVITHAKTKKKKTVTTWDRMILVGNPEFCNNVLATLNKQLYGRLKEKRYFVFINPKGGNQKAAKLFYTKIAPLLMTCKATLSVYETKHADDAKNGVEGVDLSKMDGIIVVGGDGFFSEVMTALIRRQQTLAGIDPNDPDSPVEPLQCPVGIIPAGTGNYLSLYQHGAVDPIHSAIKILQGKRNPANLVSIHQGNTLERYSGLITGFGLFGSMMKSCENWRWMGNSRYKILPLKALLARKLIASEVEYLDADSNEWRAVSGDFYGLDIGVVDLVDDGDRLVPTFGRESMSLHMTSACPLVRHIKQLSKVADWQSGGYSFDFVQSENVKKVRVSLEKLPTRRNSISSTTTMTSSRFGSEASTSTTLASPPPPPSTASGASTATSKSTPARVRAPLSVSSSTTAPPQQSFSTPSTAATLSSTTSQTVLKTPLYMNVDGEAVVIDKTIFHLSLHPGVLSLFG